ncbi:MAG: hypothetical protein RXQ98_08880 [Sulfolobaceae archaeon]
MDEDDVVEVGGTETDGLVDVVVEVVLDCVVVLVVEVVVVVECEVVVVVEDVAVVVVEDVEVDGVGEDVTIGITLISISVVFDAPLLLASNFKV